MRAEDLRCICKQDFASPCVDPSSPQMSKNDVALMVGIVAVA